ncbi:hypothetical protein B0G52_13184 [Cohnella sp. SGD-V74]|uniref:hypothetical protein n=1 Tax=unclassified Cohnella TaxID=2636738 RepID=UPI000D40D5C8|nr:MULTISPECIES: hypothetical protein [unclassified Cohnella]PRX59545.1 hypothetical protein B0G52_13184 [Cohnella sp. SGD-V74]
MFSYAIVFIGNLVAAYLIYGGSDYAKPLLQAVLVTSFVIAADYVRNKFKARRAENR